MRLRLLAALVLCSNAAPSMAQVAVQAATVHTMAGPAIADGVILISKDGKIERVGRASEAQIPAGYRTLTAKVATPGLVDAHSVVGLAGALNQPHDQMQLELSSAIQPELRAVDAYNAARAADRVGPHSRRHHDSHRPRAGRARLGPDDDRQDGGQRGRGRPRSCLSPRWRARWAPVRSPDRASRLARAPRKWPCCAPSW